MIASNKQVAMVVMLTGVLTLLPACWPFKKTQKEQDLYVINVLDKDTAQDCKIAGSLNVPFEEIESFAKDLNRKTELVVYCANYRCTASGSAAQKLKDMGFENVWAYEGGTAEWYQMGLAAEGQYPVEGACQESYLAAINEKPAHEEDAGIPVIGIDELRQKMMAHGLLSVAQVAPEAVQEAPQQAAA